jgi:MoaA/NifB/PqqE/SkfB family radical SAM enzyme
MNKEYLLTESKSFCMLPWVHFNTSPTGDVLPCCIGKTPIDEFGYHKVIANSNKDSMMEIVNATEMKKLRVDMLRDVKNPICATCHKHDSMDMGSFRTSSNKQYGNYFDTAVTPTREDGSLTEFKMR